MDYNVTIRWCDTLEEQDVLVTTNPERKDDDDIFFYFENKHEIVYHWGEFRVIKHNIPFKKISYNNLPKMGEDGLWDVDPDEYEYYPHVGIKVHDIPRCKSARKFNTLGLGEACFDGIEVQGYGVRHYVDYAYGFGTSNGTLTYTGFEEGTMAQLIDVVTDGSEVYLHFESLRPPASGIQ